MPAETHQRRDQIDAEAILDLLAVVVGAEPSAAAVLPLASLDADDDLSILHLWDAVVEEFGERSVGELEIFDDLPRTLGDLADTFHDALRAGGSSDARSSPWAMP